jgi:hypothetical protein
MALDLVQETLDLLGDLEVAGIPYALAGGVALAIHGVPRATIDIDLLVTPDAIDPALAIAHRRGFTVAAMPMRFADGMELRRVTKLAGDDALTLDLIVVNDNLEPVWRARIRVGTARGEVSVVSRAGLIQMKVAAGRPQDLADIRRLQEGDR